MVQYAGVGHWTPGNAWLRHLTAAALCLMGSGLLRLAEFFVTNGTGGCQLKGGGTDGAERDAGA